jgi:hypothetical protein
MIVIIITWPYIIHGAGYVPESKICFPQKPLIGDSGIRLPTFWTEFTYSMYTVQHTYYGA